MSTDIAMFRPDRQAALLDEAVRRIDAGIMDEVDLVPLRVALEAEMGQGVTTLAALIRVGRRSALRRLARKSSRAKARC